MKFFIRSLILPPIMVSLGLLPGQLDACTSFLISESETAVFAKSFDWEAGHGSLMVNKRNVRKTGLKLKPDDISPVWISKYGSLSFNHIGREFPLGGINEAGLAVEILVGGNRDPKPDQRPSLNEVQWIQYQLDNFGSTEEVVAHISDIRISRVLIMVHYLICDRSKVCAVVEFVDGQMVVKDSSEMPAKTLANSTYDESVDYLRNFIGFGGNRPTPTSNVSLDRFARASIMANDYAPEQSTDAVSHAFEILQSVYTVQSKWQAVYELARGIVHFRTFNNPNQRVVDAKLFDYSCQKPVQMLDIDQGRGEVSGQFSNYSTERNDELVKKSLEAKLSIQDLSLISNYPESTRCIQNLGQ
jgi:penicillin V acylase-like amidase (Ntn superfamily)